MADASAGPPDRLRLEVRSSDHLELRVTVDGRDVLDDLWPGIGPDPDDLLGPGSPLVPTGEASEVVIGVNECGDADCGSVSARIRQVGRLVVWDQFRRRDGTAIVGVPALHFDADDYRAEVARADRERDWESADRTTARLVAQTLRQGDALTTIGWALTWAAPADAAPESGAYVPGIGVCLVGAEGSVVLGFPTRPGRPDERAGDICTTILSGDEGAWPVIEPR